MLARLYQPIKRPQHTQNSYSDSPVRNSAIHTPLKNLGIIVLGGNQGYWMDCWGSDFICEKTLSATGEMEGLYYSMGIGLRVLIKNATSILLHKL